VTSPRLCVVGCARELQLAKNLLAQIQRFGQRLDSRACSTTPATPNVPVTDPGLSTNRSHARTCWRPSTARTVHVRAAMSTAVTAPISTRVLGRDAASGVATQRGSTTPPTTSGSNAE
jgi:hypothetical protein